MDNTNKKKSPVFKIPKRKNMFEAYNGLVSKFLSKFIVKTPLTPNQITVISGIFGIIGAMILMYQNRVSLIYAGIAIQLFCYLDAVDGDIARMKKMQTHFGNWLDTFFDKLNDFLIILGLSIGLYLKTGRVDSLYLGIILMGLVFFIQFLMVSNSIIFSQAISDKNMIIGSSSSKVVKKLRSYSLFMVVYQFIVTHLLLEHCAFLFLISLFCLMDQIEFGLWFLVIHAGLTLAYILLLSVFQLKQK
jgi:phosphatidylglycerophosphate synthase